MSGGVMASPQGLTASPQGQLEEDWRKEMACLRPLSCLAATLGVVGLFLAPSASWGDDGPVVDLVAKIERTVVRAGRDGGTTWFHPRACLVPADKGTRVFMTLQSISGSDVFGPVHWTTTQDQGRTWSKFQPIPGLGRHSRPGGLQEGVCDVVPGYHPRTGTILAIGHNVFYKNDRLLRPQPPRFPVYTVRNREGKWSKPRKLVWDDPRGSQIYTCGCAQRLTLDNGQILLPLSFAPKGRGDRMVTTVLCSFDGKELAVQKMGNVLVHPGKRGLLEPSLAVFAGQYVMTIRAEDGRGYVTHSDDGLHWAKIRPWAWEDGKPLTMSTTQQHWLVHSAGLYLVYTRKAAENANVFRWRAPLYLARVDPKKLCLLRASERVVLPLIGDGVKEPGKVARMGNFHTVAVTPRESWVTVGEVIPQQGYRGDLLLGRIRWNRPNRRVPPPSE
jgi:hypothetical protein